MIEEIDTISLFWAVLIALIFISALVICFLLIAPTVFAL
jgi:hypothetical protein